MVAVCGKRGTVGRGAQRVNEKPAGSQVDLNFDLSRGSIDGERNLLAARSGNLRTGEGKTALDEIFAVRLEPPLDAAYLGSSNL